MKLLILVIVFILVIQLLKAVMPGARSFHRRWAGKRTTAYRPIFAPQAGKAVVIGESGAWLNLCKELREKGLPINKPADARVLLERLRAGHKAAIDEFHTEVGGCIRHMSLSGVMPAYCKRTSPPWRLCIDRRSMPALTLSWT